MQEFNTNYFSKSKKSKFNQCNLYLRETPAPEPLVRCGARRDPSTMQASAGQGVYPVEFAERSGATILLGRVIRARPVRYSWHCFNFLLLFIVMIMNYKNTKINLSNGARPVFGFFR